MLEASNPPLLISCHIICQLGLALDIVDGVKALFLEPTFRLSQSQVGRGHKYLPYLNLKTCFICTSII